MAQIQGLTHHVVEEEEARRHNNRCHTLRSKAFLNNSQEAMGNRDPLLICQPIP